MSEFCSTFVADLTYIQCMTVSAKAEFVEPLDSFLEREEIFLFYNTFRCLPNNKNNYNI